MEPMVRQSSRPAPASQEKLVVTLERKALSDAQAGDIGQPKLESDWLDPSETTWKKLSTLFEEFWVCCGTMLMSICCPRFCSLDCQLRSDVESETRDRLNLTAELMSCSQPMPDHIAFIKNLDLAQITSCTGPPPDVPPGDVPSTSFDTMVTSYPRGGPPVSKAVGPVCRPDLTPALIPNLPDELTQFEVVTKLPLKNLRSKSLRCVSSQWRKALKSKSIYEWRRSKGTDLTQQIWIILKRLIIPNSGLPVAINGVPTSSSVSLYSQEDCKLHHLPPPPEGIPFEAQLCCVDSSVFIFGGSHGSLDKEGITKCYSLDVLDCPLQWKQIANMIAPRTWTFRAHKIDDKILLIGGLSEGLLADRCEVYDTLTDSWDGIPPMPVALTKVLSVMNLDRDRVLVCGRALGREPGSHKVYGSVFHRPALLEVTINRSDRSIYGPFARSVAWY